MTKISATLLSLTLAACFASPGCTTYPGDQESTKPKRWCLYEVASSNCPEIRRGDVVCFICVDTTVCKDRRNQQVKVRYKEKECIIKLGNRLSDRCVPCGDGKEVVELAVVP